MTLDISQGKISEFQIERTVILLFENAIKILQVRKKEHFKSFTFRMIDYLERHGPYYF